MLSLPASFSRLGMGITGPHASALVSPAATVALIKAAIAEGVTLFDTGPMYGAGEGERRLGLALKDAPRETVFVCTKARTFPLRGEDGAAPADRVRRSVEASLTRLGLDRIDALFLHGPRPEDLAAPLTTALARLKADGVVGVVGVCGRGAELDAALAWAGLDLLMMPVSGPPHRLETARERGVPVLAIETMRARGTAWRAPTSMADLWYLARAGRDALAGQATTSESGVAEALSLPAVAGVIVQTTRLSHLRANAAAARRRT